MYIDDDNTIKFASCNIIHAIFSGQTSHKMSYNFVIVMYRCINKIGVLTVNIEFIGEA